jgi:hypothetical protein
MTCAGLTPREKERIESEGAVFCPQEQESRRRGGLQSTAAAIASSRSLEPRVGCSLVIATSSDGGPRNVDSVMVCSGRKRRQKSPLRTPFFLAPSTRLRRMTKSARPTGAWSAPVTDFISATYQTAVRAQPPGTSLAVTGGNAIHQDGNGRACAGMTGGSARFEGFTACFRGVHVRSAEPSEV